jgi:DNA-binding MarR family transcriptional regulator
MRKAKAYGARLGIPVELRPVVAALQRFTAATAIQSMELWLQLDLTMPQFAALHVIWRMGPISGRQLAAHFGVSPAAVVKVCDRLEARGYIERVRDTIDRRVQWLQITRHGAAVFQQLVALKREHLRPALTNLPPNDREKLASMLNTLADQIEALHAT